MLSGTAVYSRILVFNVFPKRQCLLAISVLRNAMQAFSSSALHILPHYVLI